MPAKCPDCKKVMRPGNGCSCDMININGQNHRRIPYGEEGYNVRAPCHDCNATEGQYHHAGCDVEVCPVCKGQLISCGCTDSEGTIDTFKSGSAISGPDFGGIPLTFGAPDFVFGSAPQKKGKVVNTPDPTANVFDTDKLLKNLEGFSDKIVQFGQPGKQKK